MTECFIYFDRKYGMYLNVRDDKGNVSFPWDDYEATLPGAYMRARKDGYTPTHYYVDGGMNLIPSSVTAVYKEHVFPAPDQFNAWLTGTDDHLPDDFEPPV